MDRSRGVIWPLFCLFCVFTYFLLYDLLTRVFLQALSESNPLIPSFLSLAFVSVALSLLCFRLSINGFKAVFGERLTAYRLKQALFYALVYFPIYLGSMLVLSWLLNYLDPITDVKQQPLVFYEELQSFSFEHLMSIFMIVCFVPIVEEVVFRGFLLQALTSLTSQGLAIILSSSIFGLCHLSSEYGWFNLLLFVMLTQLGSLFAYVRFKTNCLWTAATLHILFNGINLMLA